MSLRLKSYAYLKSNAHLVLLSIGCMLVVSLFHALLLFLLGPFLTLLFGQGDVVGTGFLDRVSKWIASVPITRLAVFLPLTLVVLKSISAFSQYLYKYTQSRLFIGYVQMIRAALFERVLAMPMQSIIARVPSEWTSFLMHEVDFLKGRILGIVQGMSKDFAALLGSGVVIAVALTPVLHLVLFYVLAISVLFICAGWMLATHAGRYQKHIARMVQLAHNYGSRAMQVRAENTQALESKGLLGESSAFFAERKRIFWVSTLMAPALEFSVVLMISLLCYFFWQESIAISSAAFLSGVGAFAASLKPIRNLGQNGASLFEVYGVLKDKWRSLKSMPDQDTKAASLGEGAPVSPAPVLPLTTQPFSFTVAGRKAECPSWQFTSGKLLVVVGQSGSGKTSLFRSLVGLSGGRTSAGDKSYFAYVSQKPFLFDGTLGENIAYGLSAQSCVVKDLFDQLPDKPAWLKWDRSTAGLSGGQSYVVSFLRGLFFRERPVLVLDEPFASLDPKLEKWVYSLLQSELKAGRSIMMSTHRFDMLREQDQIWEVAEQGIRPISLSKVLEDYQPC